MRGSGESFFLVREVRAPERMPNWVCLRSRMAAAREGAQAGRGQSCEPGREIEWPVCPRTRVGERPRHRSKRTQCTTLDYSCTLCGVERRQ